MMSIHENEAVFTKSNIYMIRMCANRIRYACEIWRMCIRLDVVFVAEVPFANSAFSMLLFLLYLLTIAVSLSTSIFDAY